MLCFASHSQLANLRFGCALKQLLVKAQILSRSFRNIQTSRTGKVVWGTIDRVVCIAGPPEKRKPRIEIYAIDELSLCLPPHLHAERTLNRVAEEFKILRATGHELV